LPHRRVELTVNLPKLEPFTRDHHASWVIDSRDSSPTLDNDITTFPSLGGHTPLPALTKNRVSQKPKSRRPLEERGSKVNRTNQPSCRMIVSQYCSIFTYYFISRNVFSVCVCV
ncbi:hypothetical protein GBAR_LOCUS22658, partial [Geodia barretti]